MRKGYHNRYLDPEAKAAGLGIRTSPGSTQDDRLRRADKREVMPVLSALGTSEETQLLVLLVPGHRLGVGDWRVLRLWVDANLLVHKKPRGG